MSHRQTLQTLIDDLIRESRTPFTAEDLEQRIQQRWRRKISESTLAQLKGKLSDHHYIVGTDSDDFLPYQAVLNKIGHIPLQVDLGKFELQQRIFIPGHRLIPFLSNDRKEADLTFLDADGREIPRQKRSFCIEEVMHFYQYAGERHFPGDIDVNEWMPGKSSVLTSVWDMTAFFKTHRSLVGDALRIRLVDFDQGVFQILPCPRNEVRAGLLLSRRLHVALESILSQLCQREDFASASLQKQIMRTLFSLEEEALNVPAFSLTDFLESLKELTAVSSEGGQVQLIPTWKSEPVGFVREDADRVPKGEKGSLEEIFQDLGLAFHEWEFIAILYTVMASDKFKIELVFNLLFGGQGKLFQDRKQHDAFYQRLRKLLYKICEDLKQPESRLVAELRDKCVEVKLSLIGILRFLEENEVGLEDLPAETLNPIIDLDYFCTETLRRFADRSAPQDLKFIRDVRLALKIVLPHLDHLEEEVYFRLGIF